MSTESGELPEGWILSDLGEVAQFVMGQAPPKAETNFDGEGTVFVKAGEFGNRFPIHREWTTKPLKMAQPGDVLICVVGATCGKLNLGIECAIGRSVAAIRPEANALEQDYLYSFMQCLVEKLRSESTGSAQGVISQTQLTLVKVPVAPYTEQRRIVAKIEALQERSRKAREALAEVGPLLEQFRQSLLAAAFRGDLTADWRVANPNVEPASELLNRIRQERRQKWERDELTKYEAKGKQPQKGWQKNYQEPTPINGTGLPELPESWCWTRAEEVCAYITKGTTPPKESMTQDKGEVRFLKVGNLTFSGALDFSKENAYIDNATHNSSVYARSRIFPGDVLMNLVGPPLGKVSVIPSNLENSNINQAIAIFRPIVGLDSSYLTMVLTTPSILDRIIRLAKQTSGQRNLTLDLARGLPVPLAPLAEQLELARRLEQSLSTIESLETDFASSEAELMQLDQSILAKAFRGELVPQDPNDEPASVLLERIQNARQSAAPTKSSKRKDPTHGRK